MGQSQPLFHSLRNQITKVELISTMWNYKSIDVVLTIQTLDQMMVGAGGSYNQILKRLIQSK